MEIKVYKLKTTKLKLKKTEMNGKTFHCHELEDDVKSHTPQTIYRFNTVFIKVPMVLP